MKIGRIAGFAVLSTAMVVGMFNMSFVAPNTAHAASNIVINEVMYNPTTGGEWVELFNPTSASIDVSGLLLSDNEGVDVGEGEYWIPAGTVIPAGGYLTIGASTSTATLKWTTSGPALANAGDGIHLVRDTNADGLWTSTDKIDGVEFTSAWGANANGKSLERKNADLSSTASSTWGDSTPAGGTPGAKNSISTDSTGGGETPPPPTSGGKKVMFDNSHCNTCGNADWVINGAYSDYATELRNAGYTVVENTAAITSTTLTGVDVLVLPEPNTNFTSTEKTAINDFVLNKGKGLYIISDHIVSDRNNDGWDSVEIFNGYLQGQFNDSTEWIGNNFGFRVNEVDITQEPMLDVRSHAITSGVTGGAAAWNGATFQIVNPAYATGLVYLDADKTNPYVVASQLPSGGRVSAIGDSSPYNDGTGLTSVAAYNSWPQYGHAKLAVNTVKWLAKDL